SLEITGNAAPVSRKRAALLSLLALAAGVGATLWFEHLKYERFPAYLQARLRTVAASRDAQISEILVTSGSVVTAGQPLVRLKDPAFEQRLEAKQQQIEALEIELSQCQGKLDVELEWRRKNVLERLFEARLKCMEAVRRELQVPIGIQFGRENFWNAPGTAPAGGPASLFNAGTLIEQTRGETKSDSAESQGTEIGLC